MALNTTSVIYKCDGRNPRCAGRLGCLLHNPDGLCSMTTDGEHAINGPCADPEAHPERFRRVDSGDRIYYEEY